MKMKPMFMLLKRCMVFPLVWICAYLFLAYHSLDCFIRAGYGEGTLKRLNATISAQQSLLGVVFHGQPKERVIESVKEVLGRPEHKNVKLRISGNAIMIGGTTIYFTDGKVSVVAPTPRQ
jgi:hypothetical protein